MSGSRIAMFTNTYAPHVGGVAASVAALAEGLRARGHNVLIIAPAIGDTGVAPGELRVPALANFGGSEYALPLPQFHEFAVEISAFKPDLIHTHHPFLLGDTALRLGARLGLPVVLTFHTRYDVFDHYLPLPLAHAGRLAWEVATGYADLCDAVIAPSESLRAILRGEGVSAPIEVIPTGIPEGAFTDGDRARGRAALGIDADTTLIGHFGRLAEEKNLDFLAEAVIAFLAARPDARFALGGYGPREAAMRARFAAAGVSDRVHVAGVRTGRLRADFYAALDTFVFASRSESQGLVVLEAMAAGVPVLALDASGVRDSVVDGATGFLLPADATPAAFAEACAAFLALPLQERARIGAAARERAHLFSVPRMVDAVEALYARLAGRQAGLSSAEQGRLSRLRRRLVRERQLIGNLARALATALMPEGDNAR